MGIGQISLLCTAMVLLQLILSVYTSTGAAAAAYPADVAGVPIEYVRIVSCPSKSKG